MPQYFRLKESYEIIMWTVLTQDYNLNHSGEYSLIKSVNATRPGSIILFHDNLKTDRKTLYMLPRFIEQCLALDYQFKVL
jgi:peptidoglycan/xylan/chitin deacetylase (PgdA/CDA1 family)